MNALDLHRNTVLVVILFVLLLIGKHLGAISGTSFVFFVLAGVVSTIGSTIAYLND
jgi:hypothetical protein